MTRTEILNALRSGANEFDVVVVGGGIYFAYAFDNVVHGLEIFWKISRILDRYDRSHAFKPWMLQVARNYLVDHHRSRRREKESTLDLDAMVVEPGSSPSTQGAAVLQRERAEAIRDGLAELPEALREAVVLRDLQDLEYEEIAETLGVPLGTVKTRINRGRIRLAERLLACKESLS